jgi:hypothetical protein
MKQTAKIGHEEVDISIDDSHIWLKEVSVIFMEYLAITDSDRADLYR